MMSDPWAGILDSDEVILWQGRPDASLDIGPTNWVGFVFGLCFAGFAMVWMLLAKQAGGLFWTFGLIHFSVGLGVALSSLFWASWRRRYSWYTLTDRRAFIATDLPLQGRKLSFYPITEDSNLKIEDGVPPSVIFKTEYRRRKKGSYPVPIGFERIAEAREVYRLMRQVQHNAQTSDAG